ncbi:MAG: hypothetical protein ACWA5R_02265 [bacterium]
MSVETNQKVHWSFWLIGIAALLWNAMGCVDYFMTQTRNEAYLSGYSAEQLAYFTSFPSWVIALWATAVWSSLLGSIVFLMRKKVAVILFLVSLISMVMTTIENYVFSNGMQYMGDTFSLVFTAVIFLIALALYIYSKHLAQKGILN